MIRGMWKAPSRKLPGSREPAPPPASIDELTTQLCRDLTWAQLQELVEKNPNLKSIEARECARQMRNVMRETDRIDIVHIIDERRTFLASCATSDADCVPAMAKYTRSQTFKAIGQMFSSTESKGARDILEQPQALEMLFAMQKSVEVDELMIEQGYRQLRDIQPVGRMQELAAGERLSRRLKLGKMHHEIGETAHRENGRWEKALEELTAAAEIFCQLGYDRGTSLACYELAFVHMDLKSYRDSLESLSVAIEKAVVSNFIPQIARCRRLNANVLSLTEDFAAAKYQIMRCLEFSMLTCEYDEALKTASKMMRVAIRSDDVELLDFGYKTIQELSAKRDVFS